MYRHVYVVDKMIGAMLTVTNEAGALFFNSGSNSMPTIYCKYNFTDECTYLECGDRYLMHKFFCMHICWPFWLDSALKYMSKIPDHSINSGCAFWSLISFLVLNNNFIIKFLFIFPTSYSYIHVTENCIKFPKMQSIMLDIFNDPF